MPTPPSPPPSPFSDASMARFDEVPPESGANEAPAESGSLKKRAVALEGGSLVPPAVKQMLDRVRHKVDVRMRHPHREGHPNREAKTRDRRKAVSVDIRKDQKMERT